MTEIALRPVHLPARATRPTRPILVLVGLASLVGMRWLATQRSLSDNVGVGVLFGFGLLILAIAAGWRPGLMRRADMAPALFVGLGGATLLVLMAVATSTPATHWTPAASFWPWVAVTVLVATTQELILRGVVFHGLAAKFGLLGAVVATSLIFALMHVPAYGWRAVPLDLGVGLMLGGLRVLTGGAAAPAIAHVFADLATWWV